MAGSTHDCCPFDRHSWSCGCHEAPALAAGSAPAIDFAPVHTAVADAGLCERNGIPLFTEGTPRYPQGDVLVHLRCAEKSNTFNRAAAADLPAFAETLLKVGATLAWHYSGPARHDALARFAR